MSQARKLTLALAVLACAALFGAMFIGAAPLPWPRAAAAVIGLGHPGDQLVLWGIRAPRAVAAFLVGAALGGSGAALQGLLRNPLAEPGVLGVSATASVFAATALAFGAAAHPMIVPWAAVLGGVAATGAIAILAQRISSVVALILIGAALSSFSGALLALLMNLAPNPFSLADLVNWMLGSVANRSWEDIGWCAPPLALAAMLLARAAPTLSALTLGEEAAFAIGADLTRTRTLIVLGAGLATGAAVALAGAIGFVGMAAPHLVRPLVRHDPAASLTPSALLGGIALVLADTAARMIDTAAELKLGVIAALIGAPLFAWIAWRAGRSDD